MSISYRIINHPLSLIHPPLGGNQVASTRNRSFLKRFYLGRWKDPLHSFNRIRSQRLRSINDQTDANGFPDSCKRSSSHEGSVEKNKASKESLESNNEILMKLRRFGISGILSYGILNTFYYLTTFLLVWFYVAPAPGKMGYFAAVERFLKLMAMVWAGSQVTKLVRAAGALALAPLVDRGLSWFTIKFKFESQGKAFTAIVVLCFGLAIILFLVVTLLSA